MVAIKFFPHELLCKSNTKHPEGTGMNLCCKSLKLDYL